IRLAADLIGPDDLGQILEVDLVAYAGARRNHSEVGEGALPPLQELVTLQVPLVLQLNVTGEGVRGTKLVHDHRVVDDEIDRDKRVDLARIAAQRVHAITHGRKVHDRRHAREVLHQYAGRAEADLLFDLATIIKPRRNRGDVVP